MRDNREMLIYVQTRRSKVETGDVYIDVVKMGLDDKHCVFRCSQITGIDFIVQAYLLTQLATVQVLRKALHRIELRGATSISFACDQGTHRSVGCAVLLATLFFPKAEIHFCTPRTEREAVNHNMIASIACDGT